MADFSGLTNRNIPEIKLSEHPDRMIMIDATLPAEATEKIAQYAVKMAQSLAPKLSGQSAKALEPVSGEGYFGIYFPSPTLWYQDHGTRPFTMRSLEGKTIPMWIDDPAGAERLRNPKAKTRVTDSGRVQVLIFRKVGYKGQTKVKRVKDKTTGKIVTKTVPASYPGAPGRIANRESASPMTSPGRVGGQIAKGNVGVRWRHPGLTPRLFMSYSLGMAALHYGRQVVRVYICDSSTNIEARIR